MSETEFRRQRSQHNARKHYEDAYNGCEYRVLPAEYVGWVFTAFHAGAHGVNRGGDSVNTGHARSTPPTRLPAAMRLYRDEQDFLLSKRVPLLRGALDAIIGEAAE